MKSDDEGSDNADEDDGSASISTNEHMHQRVPEVMAKPRINWDEYYSCQAGCNM